MSNLFLTSSLYNKSDTWQNVLRDLNSPESVKTVRLPNVKNPEIVSIWEEEPAYIKEGTIIDLKYGVFVKGKTIDYSPN